MKLCSLRKFYSFILLISLAALLSLLAACGGGGSVDDSVEANPPLYTWWDGYDQKADTLISPAELDEWIANGFITDDGDPVVIIDISSVFGTDATIPGSFVGANVGYANNEVRDEGPLKASESANTTASQMVLSGETVDTILSKTGAGEDTIIVFVQKTGINTALTRVWQMFYYWGFSETKLKILDGNVSAVSTAAVGQNWATPESGDFSVKDLPQLHAVARISLAELIKALNDDSAIIWDSWGSHNSGYSKISKNRFFYSQGGLYTGGAFKPADDAMLDAILTAMIDPVNGLNTTEGLGTVLATGTDEEKKAAALNLLKTKKIITHCQAGNAAAPAYYYAKEVLPEVLGHDNVGMFDGSWSQWVAYTDYSPLTAAFDDGKFAFLNTSEYTEYVGTEDQFLGYAAKFWCRTAPVAGVCSDPVTVDEDYTGDGRDLYHEDKEYLETRTGGSGGSDNEGVDGGIGGGC